MYFGNYQAAANPPTANPQQNTFRLYLPTDAGSAPVEPYVTQQLVGPAGTVPSVGQTLPVIVWLTVVNPTSQAITFSSSNLVTANVPGFGAVYADHIAVSQGTAVSQPAVGGTGNVTWNPGTVAAGAEAILTYYVNVTPTSAGQRIPVTGTPASGNGTRAQYVDETGNTTQSRATYLFGPLCELAVTQGLLLPITTQPGFCHMSPSSFPAGTINTPYSQTISPGPPMLVGGSLPAGLSLNGNNLSGTPTTAGTFSFTLEGANPGLICAASAAYTMTIIGPLHHFAVSTVSSPQVAGTAFNVTFTAQDSNNNTVTGFNGSVNLSTTAGSISPTTSGAFTNGVVTKGVTVTQPGTGKTITADDGSGHTGTSNTFTVNVGALHHFAIGNIATQTANAPFNISLTAQDVDDNTVTAFTGTVDLSMNSGTVSPTTSSAFSSGTLTQSVTVAPAGSLRTITASRTSGAETGMSNSFTLGNTYTWTGNTSDDWNTATNWIPNAVPSSANDVSIPSAGVTNDPLIQVAAQTINDLTLGAGHTLTLSQNLRINGALTMNGNNITVGSPNMLIIGTTGSISRTSGQILGSVQKIISGAGSFTFPVGTANGYSPVDVNVSALGVNPSGLTVKAVEGPQPNQDPSKSLQRYWTLTEAGDLTANLTFNYLQGDVMGNEPGYQLFKVVSGVTQRFPHNPPNVVIDTVVNTAFIMGVSSFSDWTLGEQSSPTAAEATVSGRIVDESGNPVEGAGVRMSGTQNRLTVTDALGNYHFDNVETNGFYTVTPSRANFTFSPAQLSFSQLGLHTEAAFSANQTGNTQNPLDTTEYFVRQQYVDFLNREPDEAGLTFWVDNIESCGPGYARFQRASQQAGMPAYPESAEADCREAKRTDTSAAFFLSIEFQETGYLVYRTYQAAYGDIPNSPVPFRLSEFKPDTQEIGNGVVVNQTGWQQQLENNQQAYLTEFVQRERFVFAYPTTLTPTEFVDKLFANAGVTPTDADRTMAIGEFGSAGNTGDIAARARALQRVAEKAAFAQKEFDAAFVLMEYFGYLRRDPNTGPDTNFDGYNFWLQKLDTFNGNYQNAEMVKAFLVSTEYRGRFPR